MKLNKTQSEKLKALEKEWGFKVPACQIDNIVALMKIHDYMESKESKEEKKKRITRAVSSLRRELRLDNINRFTKFRIV